jgi:hypothetical protein
VFAASTVCSYSFMCIMFWLSWLSKLSSLLCTWHVYNSYFMTDQRSLPRMMLTFRSMLYLMKIRLVNVTCLSYLAYEMTDLLQFVKLLCQNFLLNSKGSFLTVLIGHWRKVIRNWRQDGLPSSHEGTCAGNRESVEGCCDSGD